MPQESNKKGAPTQLWQFPWTGKQSARRTSLLEAVGVGQELVDLRQVR